MPESRHRRRRGRQAGRGSRANDALSITRPRRRRTNPWYLAASITIAVLVIAGFALGSVRLGGGGGLGNTGNSDAPVEGIGVSQELTSAAHVPVDENVNYISFPPTSGNHWPPGNQARCGFYRDGLEDERAVHNLEHGNIIVSYNLSDAGQIKQLRDAVEDIGLANTWGITRFYDKIPQGQVALAAWGVLDVMDGVEAERIKSFFEAYSGTLGPEVVPC